MPSQVAQPIFKLNLSMPSLA